MNNSNKALKSGFWYIMSNFLVKGMAFLTIPVFTRLLTQEEFGIFNNFLSWQNILIILFTLNLESTIISAKYDYKEKLDEYILSVLFLSFVNTIICSIIINIFNSYFENLFDLKASYINAMLLYILFIPAVNLFIIKERFFFEYKKSIIVGLITSIGSTILSLILVCTMNNKLSGRILGAVIPTIILGIIFYLYFLKKGKKIVFSCWKYALPICLPYIPHLLSLTLLNSIDKVMIIKMCGENENALYSLAYSCGTIIVLLLTSLNSAFAPWLGEKLKEKKYIEIKKISSICIFAFMYFSIGIMLISPEVLFVLGGKKYMEAIYVLAPVSMGCVCQFLYTLFVNVEQFEKKTKGMAIGSVIAAMVNFILNYVFIPKYGYLTAAYTTLIGYIVLLLIHMYLVKRIRMSQVYNYKFILVVILVGIFLMFGIISLYSYIIIRYCVLFIYIVCSFLVIWKNRKYLLNFTGRK